MKLRAFFQKYIADQASHYTNVLRYQHEKDKSRLCQEWSLEIANKLHGSSLAFFWHVYGGGMEEARITTGPIRAMKIEAVRKLAADANRILGQDFFQAHESLHPEIFCFLPVWDKDVLATALDRHAQELAHLFQALQFEENPQPQEAPRYSHLDESDVFGSYKLK